MYDIEIGLFLQSVIENACMCVCSCVSVYIVCQMCYAYQLLLSRCHIAVTLSGSVGGRTIPFLLTRLSLRNVNVLNWSTKVCVFCAF